MFALPIIDLAVIALYFAFVIAIGIWSSRWIHNQEDYLPGRSGGWAKGSSRGFPHGSTRLLRPLQFQLLTLAAVVVLVSFLISNSPFTEADHQHPELFLLGPEAVLHARIHNLA